MIGLHDWCKEICCEAVQLINDEELVGMHARHTVRCGNEWNQTGRLETGKPRRQRRQRHGIGCNYLVFFLFVRFSSETFWDK